MNVLPSGDVRNYFQPLRHCQCRKGFLFVREWLYNTRMESLKTLSHHAYLLIGGDSAHDEVISILEKVHKIKTHGNPDFYDRKYETLTIDDARELKSLAGTMPTTPEGKKIFILSMNGATVEAQNALLKLLEEPAEYVRFFVVIPSAHLLLLTMKSRLSIVGTAEAGMEASPEALKFLKLPIAKRLEQVKALLDDISKEKKTKQDAVDFLGDLEAAIHSRAGVRDGKNALEAIAFARKYSNDRAPSLKMLLEYVALSVYN